LTTLPTTGALIGLDLGTKTIGVAISDGTQMIASPVETIARKKFKLDAERLLELIADNIKESTNLAISQQAGFAV